MRPRVQRLLPGKYVFAFAVVFIFASSASAQTTPPKDCKTVQEFNEGYRICREFQRLLSCSDCSEKIDPCSSLVIDRSDVGEEYPIVCSQIVKEIIERWRPRSYSGAGKNKPKLCTADTVANSVVSYLASDFTQRSLLAEAGVKTCAAIKNIKKRRSCSISGRYTKRALVTISSQFGLKSSAVLQLIKAQLQQNNKAATNLHRGFCAANATPTAQPIETLALPIPSATSTTSNPEIPTPTETVTPPAETTSEGTDENEKNTPGPDLSPIPAPETVTAEPVASTSPPDTAVPATSPTETSTTEPTATWTHTPADSETGMPAETPTDTPIDVPIELPIDPPIESPTESPVPPEEKCGNGVLDSGESCDGDSFAPEMDTCEEVLGRGATGTVKCYSNCSVDGVSACQLCGDSFATGTEECDGSDVPSPGTCAEHYYARRGLSAEAAENQPTKLADYINECSSDCTFDVSVCFECGNGVVETGEQCDPGWHKNWGGTSNCDPDCTKPECGDGTLNLAAGEECDDRNSTSNDGCSASCKRESCGNGKLDNDEGCDPSVCYGQLEPNITPACRDYLYEARRRCEGRGGYAQCVNGCRNFDHSSCGDLI